MGDLDPDVDEHVERIGQEGWTVVPHVFDAATADALVAELVRTFAPRLQELCGFGTYMQLIGHIDKQTPAQRLLGAPGADSLFDRT